MIGCHSLKLTRVSQKIFQMDSEKPKTHPQEDSKKNTINRKDFITRSLAAAGFLALKPKKLFGNFNFSGNGVSPSDFNKRVDELIGKMTLDEKIAQLQTVAPAIPRLNVHNYNYWSECLHGVANAGLATCFPQSIAMASSFNTKLMFSVATAISDEARAKHSAFVKIGYRDYFTGLTFFTPNINIIRDPRWGRGQETYGEDPYLTSQMAREFIKGLQGDDPKYLKLAATAKHYAVYNGPETMRHKINARVDDYDLYDTYLPAFETSVREADVASIMCAYNSLNGKPCCGNDPLLTSILRDDWHFNGYVVSDCGAIANIYRQKDHHIVDTAEQAAAMGITSGTDLNCGKTYSHLKKALQQGLITEKDINLSLHRVFLSRFKLGMFDPENEVPYNRIPLSVVNSEKHKQLAMQMARESIILLKNEPAQNEQKPLLPLSKEINSLAVIGPNADNYQTMVANYHGAPEEAVTPLMAFRRKAADHMIINYAQGSEMADGMKRLHPIPSSALQPSRGNGYGLYAEYFDNETFSGKPSVTRIDPDIDFYWMGRSPVNHELAGKFSVRWTGTLIVPETGTYTLGFRGKSSYTVYLDNEKKLTTKNVFWSPREERADIHLQAGKPYDLKIEFSNHSADPQAHLVWYRPNQNMLADAITMAKKSDAVVLCLGLSAQLESEEMPIKIDGFDGGDRTKLILPRPQKELMEKVAALGKPTILVNMSGSAVALPWAKDHIPAIIQSFYGGQAGGYAVADVIFGDYNPAGRLPVTVYKSVDDLPSFTDYSMKNRTYRYFEGKPLFPFGYGLSYTTFHYSDVKIVPEFSKNHTITVEVEVTNTGNLKGDDVAQLYINHPDYRGRQAKHALRSFQRVTLEPGEKKRLHFELTSKDISVVNQDGKNVVPRGRIDIYIGGQQPGLPPELQAKTTDVAKGTVML